MADPLPRLDNALVARGLARSRTEAQRLIKEGRVSVGGKTVEKCSFAPDAEASISVVRDAVSYVSRGGFKLAAALDQFSILVSGRTALDIGASTGGFTDCLLQRGARSVMAIDVGHGQMSPILRSDPRVTLREGVNARHLQPADFSGCFELIVLDLSFISLKLILPVLPPLLCDSGDMVCLVKPQFEVGPEQIGKGGIVRSAEARRQALAQVLETAESQKLAVRGRMDSPITGADGNQEFLIWLKQEQEGGGGASNTHPHE